MANALLVNLGTPHTLAALIVLVLHHALGEAQFNCGKGSFPTGNGRCEPCPFGTVQEDRDSCRPCVAGTFGVTKGQQGTSLEGENCLECRPGTFNPTSGATKCKPCPPGTNSGPGYRKCLRCSKGMRVSFSTQRCTNCSPGTFTDTAGNRICKPCPPGTRSDAGAVACTVCPKGSFSFKNDCRPCARGTFNDVEGANSCKICRPGTISMEGSTTCTPCPAGNFSDEIASFKCKECPVGTNSLGINPAACKDPVRGCTFSTFENADGECEACMPGERLDEAQKKCIPCAANEISAGGVVTACKKCPSDRVPVNGFALRDGSICVCRMGTEDPNSIEEFRDGVAKCRPCAPGSIGDLPFGGDRGRNGLPSASRVGNRPEPGCASCSFEQVSIDRSRCVQCSPGSVKRGNKCENCPKGSRFIQGYSENENECRSKDTGCPVGTALRGGRCSLESCPKGTFLSTSFACALCNKGCISCNPGGFRALGKVCRPCPKRQRSPGGDIRKCIKCPNNELGAGNKCICPLGTGRVRKNCVKCAPGTFNGLGEFDLNAGEDGICSPCPPGKFSENAGQRSCSECPENSVTIGSGATRCVKCPGGSRRGKDLRGEPANTCVPVDMYNKDPELLAALSDLQG